MYAPAFYRAWIDMGHEVKFLDEDSYCFHSTNKGAVLLNKIQERYHIGVHLKRYNKDIADLASTFKPDFVFLYRCYHVFSKTVKTISSFTKVFSYNNDDPFSGIPTKSYSRHFIADASYCAINYVYRKKNIADYANIGINNSKVLLPYFRKKNNFVIECKKDIPISFIGHYENDGRDALILKLKEAGIPVVVFGDKRWEYSPCYEKIKNVIFPSKRGAEYNETINRSKVCIVFFSKLNHDTYTRRCFEIPAAKSVMLCEYTDDMNSLFPEDNCAVYFRNAEELVVKAKKLLSDDLMLGRISENAHVRLKMIGGSEYDRCQEIIDDYNRLTERES